MAQQGSTRPRPTVLLLAGPNGAGKTTSSRLVIPPEIVFVNADIVSQRLADEGHPAAGRDVAAGRVVLAEIRRLEDERSSFCVETNLAGRGFVRSIARWHAGGYRVSILFIALQSPEAAIARVADRVAAGGHDVAAAVVRRRWWQGLRAFFEVYLELVDDWTLLDNSDDEPELVARGSVSGQTEILDERRWTRLLELGGQS